MVDGTIVAGPGARAAGARHLRDLETGAARGLTFSADEADRVLAFFPAILRFSEGQHAGQPFTLQPWQQFVIGSLFGWLAEDGTRRFRAAYIEAGKGAGKSPMLAGIGLYGLVADEEPGAEIYAAAVTRDQARIMFTDAKRMATASPALSRRLEILEHNIADLSTSSFFRPVSSEARALDGKRVHMALIDEIHEHPTSVVVDKMRAGTKGRRQALVIEITNSGYDRHSVCWQHHEYSLRVLDGVVENDAWFAYVCGLDAGDDWTDERVWPKANPNLGVSVTHKYLREQVAEALEITSKQQIVRRLNFCEWTESATRWLDPAQWDAGAEPVDEAALRGRPCYAGLDLSTTTDLSACVLLFPPHGTDEPWQVLVRAWVPEEALAARVRRDRVPYDLWVQQGALEATSGNVIDYDVIRERVRQLAERHDIREVAYDRWNATQIVTQLQGDGAAMVPIGQGYLSLSAPSKELERLVADRRLQHGGHPVLRWCALNAVIEQDAAGNVKPSKAKSTERIDALVALVMAVARAMVQGDARSVYESRGVLAV